MAYRTSRPDYFDILDQVALDKLMRNRTTLVIARQGAYKHLVDMQTF
ncbi:MAG: hypothetical protein IJV11_08200 [Muribaculaceae bacterium]|nr:hypothetical protein [Muribaculaceae bacterium]